MERAFRYQTGETDEIVEDLRKNGNVEVDVDSEDKIKPFLKDLERYGVYELVGIPWDYEAISFFENQDFVCRVYVEDRKNKASWTNPYIDFFSEYIEESYDDIFYG
ncbi:MAG: hypothetical protein GX041_01805 [Clostridiales bacterium]|jgi:hypothetical protein|nr:hypothetical protein [Clostridiales bacterium]